MPILDWEPGASPEAPGTLFFFEQGRATSSGFRVTSQGDILAPGNDALVWPAAEFQPADASYKGWAYDPALTIGSSSATNGTVYLTKVPVRRDMTLTAVAWALVTAAVTPTAGQNQIAVYNPAGTRLAVATVDGAVTGSGVVETAMSASLLASDGFVWVAFLFNAATPPQLARASTFSSTPNAGLTATTYRFCNNGTGQTSLAASITPASNNLATPLTYWAAVK